MNGARWVLLTLKLKCGNALPGKIEKYGFFDCFFPILVHCEGILFDMEAF